MKLTDVIHFYIGQKFIHTDDYLTENEFILTGNFIDLWNENCRLLLRPLSSMTEEEAKEFIKKNDSGIGSKNISLIIVREYEIEIHVENTTYYIWFSSISPQEYIWLITKSFDIFGLIESQQAIDITKLNKNAE